MNSRRDFLGKITAASIAFPFLKQAVSAAKIVKPNVREVGS